MFAFKLNRTLFFNKNKTIAFEKLNYKNLSFI